MLAALRGGHEGVAQELLGVRSSLGLFDETRRNEVIKLLGKPETPVSVSYLGDVYRWWDTKKHFSDLMTSKSKRTAENKDG